VVVKERIGEKKCGVIKNSRGIAKRKYLDDDKNELNIDAIKEIITWETVGILEERNWVWKNLRIFTQQTGLIGIHYWVYAWWNEEDQRNHSNSTSVTDEFPLRTTKGRVT